MALLFTVNNAQAHSGPLSEIAVKSCNEKERSDACQYEGGHQDLYIGTCQYMSTVLMCVRNQPIQIIEEKQNKAAETHVHNE
jgi:hypothetical protein